MVLIYLFIFAAHSQFWHRQYCSGPIVRHTEPMVLQYYCCQQIIQISADESIYLDSFIFLIGGSLAHSDHVAERSKFQPKQAEERRNNRTRTTGAAEKKTSTTIYFAPQSLLRNHLNEHNPFKLIGRRKVADTLYESYYTGYIDNKNDRDDRYRRSQGQISLRRRRWSHQLRQLFESRGSRILLRREPREIHRRDRREGSAPRARLVRARR